MKKIFIALFVATLLLISVSAQAQRPKEGRIGEFYFSFNAVVPIGDFTRTFDPVTMENSGVPASERPMPINEDNIGSGASTGAGLSFKYNFNFPVIEDKAFAGPFVAIDAAWNGLDSDIRTSLDKVKCTKPNYINMPIMIGANGRYYFTDIIGVFGEFGFGTDMLYITQQGWNKNTTKYGVDFSLAWQVGLGAYFGRHLSLGMHYYGFGTHTTIETDTEIYNKTLGALMFKLGFNW